MTDVWSLDASDGELLLGTGVRGRAARMGHRLTIAMTRWHATVNWAGSEPATVELVVETDSFEVLRGEGGVKGLSAPEKTLVRSNALKSLDASRFPRSASPQESSTRPPTGTGSPAISRFGESHGIT